VLLFLPYFEEIIMPTAWIAKSWDELMDIRRASASPRHRVLLQLETLGSKHDFHYVGTETKEGVGLLALLSQRVELL